MTDYETGYYVVLIFVPVIPLGRKQIIGECPRCRRHRVMPLAEWEMIRETQINNGMTRLADSPDDPSKALELLGQLTVFNRMEEAWDLANATQTSHTNNADIQIEVGGWFERHGHHQHAEACFNRAIEIAPENPACQRVIALNHLESGNPDQAKLILDQFRPPSEFFDAGLFVLLAKGFEMRAMYPEAINEYEEIRRMVPEWKQDRSIKKGIKRCQKQLKKTM